VGGKKRYEITTAQKKKWASITANRSGNVSQFAIAQTFHKENMYVILGAPNGDGRCEEQPYMPLFESFKCRISPMRRTNKLSKTFRDGVYHVLFKSQLKSKVVLQETKFCSSRNLVTLF
jgi:hypothetical protein